MSTHPTDALSTEQKQMLVDITARQLEKRLAEARELAELLVHLEPDRPRVCTCPCGDAGHRL